MDLKDARRLFRIHDVLNIDPRKRVIVCPLPGHVHYNNTPSFSIGVGRDGFDHFHCHGNCGKEGDVIDMMGYMNIPGYDDKNPEHVARAVSLLSNEISISFATPQRTPVLSQNAWMKYPIKSEAYSYLLERGLTPDTAEKFRLGQKDETSLAIPIFCEDVLWGIKFRRMRGEGMRFWAEKGSKMALFNVDNVAWKEEPVFILKGEIPVMLFDQLGLNACCMTGGEASTIQNWKHYLSFATKRILIGDNDINLEVRNRMQHISAERAGQWNADIKYPPEQYKDIDEWVLADQNALVVIRSWYE